MQIQVEHAGHAAGSEERSVHRRSLRLITTARPASAEPFEAIILDLSEEGFLTRAPGCLAVGDAVEVCLPDAGLVAAKVVWASGPYYGCAFLNPISRAVVSASLLRSAPRTEPGSTIAFAPKVIPFPKIHAYDEPVSQTLGLGTRLAVIVGASAALWTGIVLVIARIF
ncbi:PilZ domain-containing protein [Novosphingobium cyanobacteriorum]|uniref:PilZ domain-containing protein n=1 Tax=Novosphingobium cyanobacteriorum TaxID=3024215 RepID=A0ABT6CMB4_9SPHN|nr:PilZ domain-containing protein [Novosphingobium cyanobacteriorum]MDF8335007.1 PilZ domain-containing protein [Novosphingobium cyanobacteriorum]